METHALKAFKLYKALVLIIVTTVIYNWISYLKTYSPKHLIQSFHHTQH